MEKTLEEKRLYLKKINAKSYQKRKEKISLKYKEYYRENIEYFRLKKKKYWRENKEKATLYMEKWRKDNTEAVKFQGRCSNANRSGQIKLHRKDVQAVYENNIKSFGTLTCIYCLNPIVFGEDSLEHKTPLSRGGDNNKENLAVACFRCNPSKGNKTYEEHMERINQPQGAQ